MIVLDLDNRPGSGDCIRMTMTDIAALYEHWNICWLYKNCQIIAVASEGEFQCLISCIDLPLLKHLHAIKSYQWEMNTSSVKLVSDGCGMFSRFHIKAVGDNIKYLCM